MAAQDWREVVTPPARVTVRPVFFVPRGAPEPAAAERARFVRHLMWARERYHALVGTTFALDTTPVAVAGREPAAFYRAQTEDGVPDITAELLDRFRVSRFANPWIFAIVVMNSADDWPPGGGRPINGGFNSGGGVVVISSYALNRLPNVQSTLRHELGHAFGLPHVDVYGRSMTADSSLMSYNPAHHTAGFRDAARPGALGPEDRAALARNQRVFPGLTAPAATHALVPLGPMALPGHPAGRVTLMTPTDSDVVLVLPVAVTLTRLQFERGPNAGAVRRVRAYVLDDAGETERLLADAVPDPDGGMSFAPVRGRMWRLLIDSVDRAAAVRAVRFFGPEGEVFGALR